MTVAELCIVMLTTGCTSLECEGEEFNTVFDFNDKYGSRTIRSVQRIVKHLHYKDDVLIKVDLEDEDWLLDALQAEETVAGGGGARGQ